MENQLGTRNLTEILVFGISAMLKANSILEDKKVTIAEGINASLYVLPRVPQILKSAKEVVAEYKDLTQDELVEMQKKVMIDLRIDNEVPDAQRALWIVKHALEVGVALYELNDSFKGDIPVWFGADNLLQFIKSEKDPIKKMSIEL
jgi:hypothetical protein